MLVSDTTDFNPEKIKKDEEGHYIMVKNTIQQEDLTVLNIYAPNAETPGLINKAISYRPSKRLGLPHDNSGRLMLH